MDELTSIINKIIDDLNFDEFEYDTDKKEWFHLFDKTHYDIIYMTRYFTGILEDGVIYSETHEWAQSAYGMLKELTDSKLKYLSSIVNGRDNKMKREILFRGKTFDNNWIEGYLFKSWNDSYILWGTTNGIPNMKEVQSNTIGQYVGMYDIQGNHIFENDIVKTIAGIGYIKFKKSKATYEIVTDDWNLPFDEVGSEIEIIGNIYDNGELL